MGWVRLDEVGKFFLLCGSGSVDTKKSENSQLFGISYPPLLCSQYLVFKIISFEKVLIKKHEVGSTFSMSI